MRNDRDVIATASQRTKLLLHLFFNRTTDPSTYQVLHEFADVGLRVQHPGGSKSACFSSRPTTSCHSPSNAGPERRAEKRACITVTSVLLRFAAAACSW